MRYLDAANLRGFLSWKTVGYMFRLSVYSPAESESGIVTLLPPGLFAGSSTGRPG